MKKILITLTLLFLTPVFSFPFKDIFIKGNIGDFSIYQSGNSVTILNIHTKELPYIVLEEITLPRSLYETVKGLDLSTWVKKGAPGSTSWTLMEIEINTLEVTNAFCFSRKAHLLINKEDALISSLLNLDIKPIAKENLSRVGPRPHNKRDTRAFWQPTMIVSGEKKKPKKMDVYSGFWTNDTSALSNKEIDLYILNDFPFPYWIQIKGDLGSKKMISLDSGKNLISPIEKIPTMPPSFLSGLEKWNNDPSKYSFLIQTNRSHKEYTTYLMELGDKKNKLIYVESKYHNIETGVLKFNLTSSSLKSELTPGKKYRLYLSYENDGEIKSILSKDIIHWK
ncbi:MAG: hypothetical protein S4CHLAM20_11050 [Chlamydiia bacterium]|nr:hypothetical protein [Chlamydiia bacterium]